MCFMGELDFEKVTRSFGAKGVGNSATSTQFSYTSIIQSVLGANDSKNSCEELCHTSSSLLDNQEADLPVSCRSRTLRNVSLWLSGRLVEVFGR